MARGLQDCTDSWQGRQPVFLVGLEVRWSRNLSFSARILGLRLQMDETDRGFTTGVLGRRQLT